MKHWTVLDITKMRIPMIKEGIVPPYMIETFGMPKVAKIRPLNPELSKKVEDILIEWTTMGVIKECESISYGSRIVVVMKKDGPPRCCCDYKSLNYFTVKEPYPVPSIETSLKKLAEKKHFNTLDCRSAYFSIPIDEESKKKTAI